MDTDKLVMIEDDALDAVAGGGPGETLQKLWELRLNAGLESVSSTLDYIEEQAGIWKGLVDDVRKALK